MTLAGPHAQGPGAARRWSQRAKGAASAFLLLAAPALAQPAFPPGESFDIQFTEAAALDSDVAVFDLDPDDATLEQIAALTARGVKPICYVSVGTVEDWRADADAFPPALVGLPYEGWPGERFLDARRIGELIALMRPRFARCKQMGFAGIEADNIDLQHNETGFPLGAAEALAYARAVTALAHEMGLAIGQKNAPDLIPELADEMDFLVTEDCFADGWCAETAPYIDAGKAVFAIEYDDRLTDPAPACAHARELGLSMVVKDRALTAPEGGCHNQGERP